MISEAHIVEFRAEQGFWKTLLLWGGGIVVGVFLLSLVITLIIWKWKKRDGESAE